MNGLCSSLHAAFEKESLFFSCQEVGLHGCTTRDVVLQLKNRLLCLIPHDFLSFLRTALSSLLSHPSVLPDIERVPYYETWCSVHFHSHVVRKVCVSLQWSYSVCFGFNGGNGLLGESRYVCMYITLSLSSREISSFNCLFLC